jgi:predicted amino acid racemase
LAEAEEVTTTMAMVTNEIDHLRRQCETAFNQLGVLARMPMLKPEVVVETIAAVVETNKGTVLQTVDAVAKQVEASHQLLLCKMKGDLAKPGEWDDLTTWFGGPPVETKNLTPLVYGSLTN